MEVHLTEDQRAFVREAIQAGRSVTEEDALQEALLLRETRERRRAEILAAVDQAESSVARGEGRRITTPEEASKLADKIKQRGAPGWNPNRKPVNGRLSSFNGKRKLTLMISGCTSPVKRQHRRCEPPDR